MNIGGVHNSKGFSYKPSDKVDKTGEKTSANDNKSRKGSVTKDEDSVSGSVRIFQTSLQNTQEKINYYHLKREGLKKQHEKIHLAVNEFDNIEEENLQKKAEEFNKELVSISEAYNLNGNAAFKIDTSEETENLRESIKQDLQIAEKKILNEIEKDDEILKEKFREIEKYTIAMENFLAAETEGQKPEDLINKTKNLLGRLDTLNNNLHDSKVLNSLLSNL